MADVWTSLLAIAVLLTFAYVATAPEQRLRILHAARIIFEHLRAYGADERQAFHQALRARTRFAVVTLTLVALNVIVFVGMVFDAGALADPSTRVAWGASVGPRTTNGEWGRLLTMAFVHGSAIALVVNMAALVQVGIILERLVGRITFALNGVIAIVFAALATVSAYPTTVSAGASGMVFGTYGLLTAYLAGGLLRRAAPRIPAPVLFRLALMAALFVLYNLAASGLGVRGDFVGFVAGLIFGLVVAREVSESAPAPRRLGQAFAVAAVVAVIASVPLRGMVDLAPEIQRLVDVEQRTANLYDAALDKFRRGRVRPGTLAEVIDRSILPELEAADQRIQDLRGVPAQDLERFNDAKTYLRLRLGSWRLRSQGIRDSVAPSSVAAAGKGANARVRAEQRLQANNRMMASADTTASEALQAFKRISVAPASE